MKHYLGIAFVAALVWVVLTWANKTTTNTGKFI